MAGLFYNLGRKVGPKVRKAQWMWQSMAGSEEKALKMENLVGRDLAAEVRRQLKPAGDNETELQLNEIGTKLVRSLVKQNRSFSFELVQQAEPNAFALPGGFVFVTDSLANLCSLEDEIAFFLSHEMAHIVRGHAMDRIIHSSAISAAARAAPLRGALAGWLKKVGISFLESAYSRETETEADTLALHLSAAAGYDPRASITFFRKLAKLKQNEDSNRLGCYFGSHPPFEQRIGEIESLLKRIQAKS